MGATGDRYTVVDLETTGLFANGTDRVIELALVTLGAGGEVVDEYATLVNPGRDIGPTRIHGIESWEIAEAPTFADIIGDVSARLADRVAVAHNASFDLRFIAAEFGRLNHHLPPVKYICTLEMARLVGGDLPARNLTALCEHYDIDLPNAHTALDDARATAALLRVLLRGPECGRDGADLPYQWLPGTGDGWPNHSPSGRACQRGQQRPPTERGADFISRVVARLPSGAETLPDAQEYLCLLDRVLEDRRVTIQESEMLLGLAASLGLSRSDATAAHRHYLRGLVDVALSDHVLTEFEMRDLAGVATLLSVPETELDQMIQAARKAPQRSGRTTSDSEEVSGLSVCFTGELMAQLKGSPVDREFAARIATERGMVVKSGVSRKLDILVAADPDSNSGKAKKAREYGIRIISEAQFWKMVGVQVQ
jgi:DNA polymerase-3 subunit epsilon